ncbi:DUF2793 domain-containing protein [Methylobacterium durans]|uniref:DUF2793 domain-containing protein n=1 Tax=Methylobacterium durans TaxID=2202825 RepID=UPI001F4014C6|nr:DUF2793 domain-containing protein [Methylobacterium durans]
MSTTRHLALPLLAAAQAQKHVTHNEALALLDALVQLACLDKDRTAPPASPAEGDRYLLAAQNPTGAWAGLSGQIACFEDGVWIGLQPRPGWLAYLVDEAELYLCTGGGWTPLRTTLQSLQNLTRLGINTAADGGEPARREGGRRPVLVGRRHAGLGPHARDPQPALRRRGGRPRLPEWLPDASPARPPRQRPRRPQG